MNHSALCTLNNVLTWPIVIIFILLFLLAIGIITRELLLLAIEKWPSFKVRCDGCDGTGLCTAPDPLFPHSCDGECRRIYVPESWVPPNFKGNWHEPGERFVGTDSIFFWPFHSKIQPNIDERYAFIGCGWVRGSLWQRLRKGGPRKMLGIQNRSSVAEKPAPPRTNQHTAAHRKTT